MMKNNLNIQGYESRFHVGTGFSLVIGLIISLCILFSYDLSALASGMNDETKTDYIVVIDPGHGGENFGTIENGFTEKDMDFLSATVMAETLKKYEHVQVYMTREADEDFSLEERAEFAASVNADFLISVHYNASVKHDLFGTEAWVQLNSPLHAYGYTFGRIWVNKYREEGFFLRGVKTKESETTKGIDYYGILRHCAAAEIPAVIIEHGHVDHENDAGLLDEESEQIHFGILDGMAVAEFLGLPLKKEYAQEEGLVSFQSDLPPVKAVDEDKIYFDSINPWTYPEICTIEKVSEDYDQGIATILVNGSDYDSPLIYYCYSIDGGATYSDLFVWPDADVMTGKYKDSFTLDIPLEDNKFPYIVLKAYNMFDQSTTSNVLDGYSIYHKRETEQPVVENAENSDLETEESEETLLVDSSAVVSEETEESDGVVLTQLPSEQEEWTIEQLRNEKIDQLFNFLLICLFIVVAILWLVFALLLFYRRKKH